MYMYTHTHTRTRTLTHTHTHAHTQCHGADGGLNEHRRDVMLTVQTRSSFDSIHFAYIHRP
jgi:hypothetical protein